ncbi:hypothetical protein CVT25_012859 [Psilocybe cyanescens]|uniref:Extracellular membrane protein CFEM domain-containing protein n=1 Tax=Psilocybe cyanescens TaxID=93625 RepID=A0A409XLT7_PSICY|nr:hypothetical protein CVT25_012859 [Psilocybe cyanescens]
MVAPFVLSVALILAIPLSVVADLTITNSVGLFSRQITGFDPSKLPASCIQTKCQDFVNKVTAAKCVTLDCLCTNDIVSAVESCEQCGVDANINGFNQTVVDNSMTAFVKACGDAGHPISGISTSGSGSSVGTSIDIPTSTGINTATSSTQSGISEISSFSNTTPTTPTTTPSSNSGSGSSSTPTGAAAALRVSVVGIIFTAALGAIIFI